MLWGQCDVNRMWRDLVRLLILQYCNYCDKYCTFSIAILLEAKYCNTQKQYLLWLKVWHNIKNRIPTCVTQGCSRVSRASLIFSADRVDLFCLFQMAVVFCKSLHWCLFAWLALKRGSIYWCNQVKWLQAHFQLRSSIARSTAILIQYFFA